MKADKGTHKRVYERPRLESSEPFERLALYCTGADNLGNGGFGKEERGEGGRLLCQRTQTSS